MTVNAMNTSYRLPRSIAVFVGALLIGIGFLIAPAARAQTPLSPKALGMGSAYTAVARGHEALLYNPANLGLSDSPRWSLALAGLTVGGTAGGPGFRDYADFVTERSDEDAFLGLIPASGASLDLDAHASALTLQVGGFALGASYHAVARQRAPRDVFELYVNGYEPGRTRYEAAGAATTEADYLDVAAGYGFNLGVPGRGEVSVGATVHYLRGRQLASRAVVSGARLHHDEEYGATVELDYRDLMAEGGNGFALDLGMAWKPRPRWTFSGSVTNLVSTMAWGEMRERTATGSADDLLDLEFFTDASSQEGTPVAAGDPEAAALLEVGRLPRTLRLGTVYQPIRRTYLAAAYQRRTTDGALAGRWEHVLSAGLEQNIPLLPLTVRGGYAAAFGEGRALTLGASVLGFIHAGVARMSYDQDSVAHDHWTASVGVTLGGRRPWFKDAK